MLEGETEKHMGLVLSETPTFRVLLFQVSMRPCIASA